MKQIRWIFCGLLLLISLAAHSDIEAHQFNSAEEEAIYLELVKELRCLVCQNQNLEASNSGLAKDLRQQVLQLVLAGQTKQQISQYMTQRYGDFVLYQPPFKATTWVLWLSPFIILMIAAWVLFVTIKRAQSSTKNDQATTQSSNKKDAP